MIRQFFDHSSSDVIQLNRNKIFKIKTIFHFNLNIII